MRVIVVGAGPAGAATALLLARSGAEVVLLEREPDFARVFRGEGLMPSGVDALRQMGLGPLLDEVPSRLLEAWDVYINGHQVFSVPEPIAELGPNAVRVVPQPELLAGMVHAARACPTFRFEPSTPVRDLLTADGRVAGVRAQGPDGACELRADLVVGCDGRASVVRKRAGLELLLLPEHYDVLWFRMPVPERLRGRTAMLLMASRRGFAACYPSWDDRLHYALMIPKGGYRERRDADWPAELAKPAPPWLAGHVRAVAASLEGPMLLDVIVGRCRAWSAPGVLLLGDAAHPMSPVRAQGINVALRDAIVAANHLVPPLRAGAGAGAEQLDAAARAVQAEREPDVVRAQTLQLRDTRGIRTPVAPVAMALARVLGPLLGRYAWAKRAWLAQQHDLRFGARPVTLHAGAHPTPTGG